jgi:hypothetical protein
MRRACIAVSRIAPQRLEESPMVATAFPFYTVAGNVTVLVLLAICVVLLLGAISWMLKD